MKLKKRKPRVVVLRTGGTNCDRETAFAFRLAGAQAQILHINHFIAADKCLLDFDILAIPGGFSYGDDIAAGKILANELKYRLGQDLLSFIARGKLIIGICNGFQVLVKAGILPGNLNSNKKADPTQIATLTINDSNKFEDRWVYLKSQDHKVTRSPVKCVWIKGLPEVTTLPVAHGEGKFICRDNAVLKQLNRNGQIVLRYCDRDGNLVSDYPLNPNGSMDNIAGICDKTGKVLGLMPHPERHIWKRQSPLCGLENFSPSKCGKTDSRFSSQVYAEGLGIFMNGVRYVRDNL